MIKSPFLPPPPQEKKTSFSKKSSTKNKSFVAVIIKLQKYLWKDSILDELQRE